jgi:hypothetical protein
MRKKPTKVSVPPRQFHFGYAPQGVSVEIPEFDAFLNDIEAACKKHGFGLEKRSNYDEGDYLVVVPYESNELVELLVSGLSNYVGGYSYEVPILSQARKLYQDRWGEYNRERDARIKAEAALATKRKAKERAQKEAEKIAKLRTEGVTFKGKKYKLVEEK